MRVLKAASPGGDVSPGRSLVLPQQDTGTSQPGPTLGRPLTTAESLVLEIVVAHHLLKAPCTVLSSAHWVRPQLDSLADLELITWAFDEDGDFTIVPRLAILSRPESIDIGRRLGLPLSDS